MTVARAIETLCPGFPFIYLGDIARSPYGSKSPSTITEYSHRNTEFLLRQGAKLIVIACNSAASTASTFLRNHYSHTIIDVIHPAVAKAASVSVSGSIGVIGTRATINSGLYDQHLHRARHHLEHGVLDLAFQARRHGGDGGGGVAGFTLAKGQVEQGIRIFGDQMIGLGKGR